MVGNHYFAPGSSFLTALPECQTHNCQSEACTQARYGFNQVMPSVASGCILNRFLEEKVCKRNRLTMTHVTARQA